MEKKDVQRVEELDFVSPKFNPLAVLNAEDLQPPCPEVSGFNSLREYEMVVREKRHPPSSRPSSTFPEKTLATKEQDGEASKVKSSPTVRIDFLEAPHHGPLGMLQQWYHSNAQVSVWIRHSAGVRGVCAGRLVAFDKHWNIVLRDVEEIFVPFDERNLKRTKKKKKRKPRVSPQVLLPNSSELTSHDHMPSTENSQSEDRTKCVILAIPPEGSGYKLSYCTELYRKPPLVRVRTLAQLFIRGDNIVLIAKTQSHNT